MKWRAYHEYEDSGVEWLGEIPAHWEARRLKYASSLNDETLGETTDPDFELLYVDISSVDAIEGIQNKERQIFQDAPSRARRKVKHGDVIVSTVRTYLRAIAPIVEPEENLIVSTGFAVVRPANDLESRFAFYALRTLYFVESVVANSVGVSYPAINASELATLPIVLPPAEEQRAISAFLDRETGHIDALIAKKERQIELLQEKRAALISQAVTKGLDPGVPMKDSGIEWLGEIPAHWDVVRAKGVFYEVNERSESGEEELLSVSHITGVTPRSEKNVYMFMAETHEGYKKCRPGDLVINTMWAWMGALGTAFHQGIVSPSYNVYRLRSQNSEPRYYDRLFRTGKFVAEINRFSKGIWKSRLRLYPEGFFEIRIPCPPRGEQRVITDYLDQHTEYTDRVVKKVQKSIEILSEYRIALISAAVTGKIDVRDAPEGEAMT
jgi:type I restriction enzyme S subunit